NNAAPGGDLVIDPERIHELQEVAVPRRARRQAPCLLARGWPRRLRRTSGEAQDQQRGWEDPDRSHLRENQTKRVRNATPRPAGTCSPSVAAVQARGSV